MPNEPSEIPLAEKRSEPRSVTDVFFSVEIAVSSLHSTYHFRLRDISQKGVCILVKEDSDILGHLSVGDQLEMTFYAHSPKRPASSHKTQIRHITKGGNGQYSGHFMVGLVILDDH